MEKLIDKFLRYVSVDTQSDEDSQNSPSTEKQHVLAEILAKELRQMGMQEVYYDKAHCYVYAKISASEGFETLPALGFIAHMDTSPAVSGKNVRPKVVEDYDGKDICLNEEQDIWLKVGEFPELEKLVGDDLIVTDGTTLLGADDKAGVAEIMTMAEMLMENKSIVHGPVRIAFTPDEEIGCGTDYFDIQRFDADYAYTVDGGALGELEFGNFNAASGKVIITGRNVHPGSAKGKMINAILVAQEFQGLLPEKQNPMYTEMYEGFFHLDRFCGTVDHAEAEYIIRDHDRGLFEEKKALFQKCAEEINKKYGSEIVVVEVEDSYYNMREIMEQHMHLIHNACDVMKAKGIEPIISPIRGGTDGARLSFMGLPCPNLCTGGANYHSRFEYASLQSMEKTVEVLLGLCQKYGEKKKIKNLIFDVGEVLVEYRWREMLTDYGVSLAEAERIGNEVFEHPMWSSYIDPGHITIQEAIKRYSEEYPKDAKIIEFFLSKAEKMVVERPEIWEEIGRLKAKGYGIYLLSNYSQELLEKHTKGALFWQYVDGGVISYEVHAIKPDSVIYETLLGKYHLQANECLFFDDRVMNIKAAKQMGLQGLVVKSRKELLEYLKKL